MHINLHWMLILPTINLPQISKSRGINSRGKASLFWNTFIINYFLFKTLGNNCQEVYFLADLQVPSLQGFKNDAFVIIRFILRCILGSKWNSNSSFFLEYLSMPLSLYVSYSCKFLGRKPYFVCIYIRVKVKAFFTCVFSSTILAMDKIN